VEVVKKVITHTRPDRFDIYGIGDIHAGSIHCSESKIIAKVQEIKENEKAYWIGMGDYADSITSQDKRWDACGIAKWVKKKDIIESQENWLIELFTPIKSKCLGLLTGNHEETVHDKHDSAITEHLCGKLEVPYLSYACFVDLVFDRSGSKKLYQIFAWHGSGAAQSDGGKLMRLMKLVNEIQADIYLMGHLHDIVIKTPHRLKCSNGKVKSTPLVAAMTGSWLTAYTQPHTKEEVGISYAEKKGYTPNRIGCPVIHIFPDKEIITVEA
jgi:hypothetical protein